jgi:tight adherence protein C
VIAATVFVCCAVGGTYIVLCVFSSERRISKTLKSTSRDTDYETAAHSLVPRAKLFLTWIRVHLSFQNSPKLGEQMKMAGLNSEWQADAYVASRLLLPPLIFIASTFLPQSGFFGALVPAMISFVLPDLWLSHLIRMRRTQIRLALPDTIDLLVICVEAGLGLDQALHRVGDELSLRHKAISEELAQINLEQRAGKPRIEAWRSMAKRTHLEEVDSFVAMLWQSDRFGTPIVRGLASFAESLRTMRRQHAEELAAKSTIKLIFPLVLFIFPSMFVVLIGPAALNVMHNLGGLFD